MFKDYHLILLVIASVKIAYCENSDLPQVFIPERKIFLPENPPKPPQIYLAEQKFSLPQFCHNASEWEDVDLSFKILTDPTEEPEKSAFSSLVNLVKFILIKEELPCLNAMTGPILQVKRPEGKIFNAVPVDSKQIATNIERALANKPKHKATPVDFHDSIDINNMIPIWRPRGNNRRKNQANTAPTNGTKVECACKAGPKVLQNLGKGITVVGANLSPITKGVTAKAPCKCQKLTLNVRPKESCNLQCENLPTANVKPVVLGCGRNCNICQKLSSPPLSGCPKLSNAAIVSGCGCPKTNMVIGGYSCSKPVMACPKRSADIFPVPCKAKQAVTVLQSEAVPMVNCFGNLMKKVTTTVLMPY